MKKLKWIVLAVVVLVVVGVGIVLMNLNGIVRRTVESQATSSLDLKTTLAAAHVSIFGGSLSLDDLQIASPQGFTAPRMMSLDKAGVNVSLGDLRGDPVHIQKVQIDAPVIVLELAGTKMNFQAVMDKPSNAPTNPKESSEPLKVIIDELTVTNPKVTLMPGSQFAALGLKDISLTLPTISLKGIGTGEGNKNGAAIKEVVMQLLTTIAAKAADSDQLPPELKNVLNMNVQQVAQQLGKRAQEEIGKQVGKVTEDLQKNLPGDLKNTDAGKQIEKSIGDVLGGKKDKKDEKKK